MNDRYQTPLAERYASKEMQYIFSPDMKFKTWRRLWIALAETEHELGLPITQEQIDELKAHKDDINYEDAKRREKEVRHDVMSHVYAYGLQCPKAKGIIHLGATSCYVGDNTDIIIMTEGLKLVRKKLVNVIDELSKFADKYKAQPTLAFTHFQPAQPTTVGKRATLWLNGGSVAINGNVFVKNGGGNPGNTVDAGIMVFKGQVDIYSGYFYAGNDATGAPNPCIHLAGDSYNGTCVLNVYGGVFESETETNNYLINVQDSKSAATWNKIAIYGGIFVGFNPANGDSGTNISTFVADGYESVQTTYNGKTAWEIKKIEE